MNSQVSLLLMLMLCLNTSLLAEEQTTKQELPSTDFLEFLGEWETEEGEWVDPVALEDDEVGELIETVNEEVQEPGDEN